jgi:hypothetical protein
MPLVPFSEMPDSARVWVFGASGQLEDDKAETLIGSVQSFISGWLAHGRPVYGAMDWRFGHFLIIAADEEASGVSGCSIDALFRTLKTLEAETGTTLMDSSLVWYREPAGEIKVVSRPEFRALASAGAVAEETIVFDNTVASVGAIRAGEWKRKAADSWHGRAFLATRQKS